jgi:hypothetical protein
MAKTPRSRKAKGRRFQQEVRDKLLEEFKDHLEPDDVRCTIMGQSGEDIILSPAARKLIPYSIEAKNQEKLNIWSALEQAESNCKSGIEPVLAFKRNNSKAYAVISLDHFIKLMSVFKPPVQVLDK